MSALERERARRYRSALDIAEDLGRFNRGERLSVRQGTLGRAARLFLAARRRSGTALRVAAGFILLVLGVWGSGVLDTRPRVAVLPLSTFQRGDSAVLREYSTGVQRLLIGEFGAHGGFATISVDDVARAYVDLGLAPGGPVSDEEVVALGRELGVEFVVHGQGTEIVDQLRVAARIVRVSDGTVAGRSRAAGDTDDLFPMTRALMAPLIAGLEGDSLPTEASSAEETPGLVLSRAMQALRGGDLDEAVRLVEYVVERWPEHPGGPEFRERIRQDYGR